MNDQNYPELMKAPVYQTMPERWLAQGIVRQVNAGTPTQRFEMLYVDGWGAPFWGPLLKFTDHFEPS